MESQPEHHLEYPKVTELPVVRQTTEHDPFIEDLTPCDASITPEVAPKLAKVLDLSANVIEVDFGNHGKAA